MQQAGTNHNFLPAMIYGPGTGHNFWPKTWPKAKKSTQFEKIWPDTSNMEAWADSTQLGTRHQSGTGRAK
jgi:hypothetical protein